jgi:excisionase family DNA binding protein
MEKLLIPRIEAAKYLSISVDTLDWLRRAKKLRAVTIGARVYYSPEELQAFVKKEGSLC